MIESIGGHVVVDTRRARHLKDDMWWSENRQLRSAHAPYFCPPTRPTATELALGEYSDIQNGVQGFRVPLRTSNPIFKQKTCPFRMYTTFTKPEPTPVENPGSGREIHSTEVKRITLHRIDSFWADRESVR